MARLGLTIERKHKSMLEERAKIRGVSTQEEVRRLLHLLHDYKLFFRNGSGELFALLPEGGHEQVIVGSEKLTVHPLATPSPSGKG